MKILVRSIQRGAERRLQVPADYLGHIGDTSFSGLLKLLLMLPVAGHHRRDSRFVTHAARIVVARHEDCGTCVQIAVNAATDEGMPADLTRAILESRFVPCTPSTNFGERQGVRLPLAYRQFVVVLNSWGV